MTTDATSVTRDRTEDRLRFVWPLAGVLVAVEFVHDATGFGSQGLADFFENWWHNGVLWLAAALAFIGARRSVRGRSAWVLIALALAMWAVGDSIWSILYGSDPTPPAASIADVFWLLWYPLSATALVLLIRDRVPGFELHRWIDGVVVVLIAATPWVSLFLQPVAEASGLDPLGEVLEFGYPIGDFMLVGGILGVYAIMGWRPGRVWMLLGIGYGVIGILDSIISIETFNSSGKETVYGSLLLVGALLISYASWQPHPGRLEKRMLTGWPAIILPLLATVAAAALQIYGLFRELPRSEGIFTLVVLVLSMIQIVSARPRPDRTEQERETLTS